jgi:hypothetical protein
VVILLPLVQQAGPVPIVLFQVHLQLMQAVAVVHLIQELLVVLAG